MHLRVVHDPRHERTRVPKDVGFKCPVQHLGGDHDGGISVTLIFVRRLRKQLVSSHQTTVDTCGIHCYQEIPRAVSMGVLASPLSMG